MSIQYHIYSNDGAGGVVDYTSIITTTSATSWMSGALSGPLDRTWAVRAYDTATGVEETNVDATVRLVLNPSAQDVTNRPAAPIGLVATIGRNSSVSLSWQYARGSSLAPPTGFHVYLGTPTPNYAMPIATVPYLSASISFRATVSGLTSGAPYQAVVRAYNGVEEEGNTDAVSFTPSSTGPLPVDSLTGSAVP
jgi:hypothetical protein